MKQLWLDGRRIDSIQQLRQAVSACEADRQLPLCAELLEKAADGILMPWFDRCDETRLFEDEWMRQSAPVPPCGRMESLRRKLEQEADVRNLSDDGLEVLSQICGADVSVLRVARDQRRRHAGRFPYETVRRQVEQQAWYREDDAVRQTFSGLRWDRVVVNSDMLRAVLARIRDRARGDTVDVYLCNVGLAFLLRQPQTLANVRLLGFGCPLVQLDPEARGRTIDMAERRVVFEKLCLSRQGVRLANAQLPGCTSIGGRDAP